MERRRISTLLQSFPVTAVGFHSLFVQSGSSVGSETPVSNKESDQIERRRCHSEGYATQEETK